MTTELTEQQRESARNLPEIAPLSPREQDALLQYVTSLRLRPGQVLFGENVDDGAVYYLTEGAVSLSWKGRSIRSIQAKPADESEPLDREGSKIYTVQARTPTVVLRFPRDRFDVATRPYQSGTGDFMGTEVTEIGDELSKSWMVTLLRLEVFARLPTANLEQIFERLEQIEVKAGTALVSQGEQADYYYIVQEGLCEVWRQSETSTEKIHIADIGPNGCFGEEAIIADSPRNATVVMRDDGLVLRLDRASFKSLIQDALIEELELDEARRKVIDGSLWLDARDIGSKRIPEARTAICIPLPMLRDARDQIDKSSSYITFAETSGEAAIAAFLLAERGRQVFYLSRTAHQRLADNSSARAKRTRASQRSTSQPSAAGLKKTPESAPAPQASANVNAAHTVTTQHHSTVAAQEAKVADPVAKSNTAPSAPKSTSPRMMRVSVRSSAPQPTRAATKTQVSAASPTPGESNTIQHVEPKDAQRAKSPPTATSTEHSKQVNAETNSQPELQDDRQVAAKAHANANPKIGPIAEGSEELAARVRKMSDELPPVPRDELGETIIGQSLANLLDEMNEHVQQLPDADEPKQSASAANRSTESNPLMSVQNDTSPEAAQSALDSALSSAAESINGDPISVPPELNEAMTKQAQTLSREIEQRIEALTRANFERMRRHVESTLEQRTAELKKRASEILKRELAKVESNNELRLAQEKQAVKRDYQRMLTLANRLARQKAGINRAREQLETKLQAADRLQKEIFGLREMLSQQLGDLEGIEKESSIDELPSNLGVNLENLVPAVSAQNPTQQPQSQRASVDARTTSEATQASAPSGIDDQSLEKTEERIRATMERFKNA